MDPIRLAFQKAKEEINLLKQEIVSIKREISLFNPLFEDIRLQLFSLNKKIDSLKTPSFLINNPKLNPTHLIKNPTHLQHTSSVIMSHNLKNNPIKPQKDSFYNISTGNEGVPTDRQTNQQTDRNSSFPQKIPLISSSYYNFKDINSHEFFSKGSSQEFPQERLILNKNLTLNKLDTSKMLSQDKFKEALNVLDSLDLLKREIKQKFKQLTDQEFLVFSTIYQLEEENLLINYKTLSSKLNLTESSIRDYVGKLLIKNSPVIKEKINNKTIKLSISPEFKKIISLPSLINIRSS